MSPSPRSTLAGLRATLRDVHGDGRGWTLLAVAAGWFFVLGLRFVVPALLPAITRDFPVSNATAGAAITLLWVTYAMTQFPAGALVDRLGERRLLVASVLVGAAGLVGYAFSPTFGVFLAATAAFGFGSGLYGPPRGIVLSRTFPDRDGLAFGGVLAAGSLGAALLPAIATGIATTAGWRTAIAVTIPGFLVVALALWRVVPGGHSSDAVPATDGGTASLRAVAVTVADAIRSRRVGLAVLGATLMLFIFQGLTAFFTTYLVTVKDLSPGTAGLLFGLLFVSGALWQSVGGGLADRYGHGTVLAAVALFGALPLAVLPFVSGTLALAVVAALLGIRLSMGPVSNAYIVSLLPTRIRGTVWGLLRTIFFTVGAFGSTVVGTMADRALFAEAFFLLAGLSALAGVVYLFLPAREGGRERASGAD
ncbi:MFS transporter [Salinibaculum rarum]|uniref:MFS transporter n=1 Tax=Salinibaculum rarum TaxID=3058903 RepID=UPI00265F4011|nr:MFS transporter [Salinibaculum sp. KK48]